MGTLYHPTNAEFPIKQQIAEKIAGSGISYQDLKNVFKKFGAKGLVGVLSLPPSSATSKAPRVTLREGETSVFLGEPETFSLLHLRDRDFKVLSDAILSCSYVIQVHIRYKKSVLRGFPSLEKNRFCETGL